MTAARHNPIRIGLTGGIGCGKSTVAALFANLGVAVFDADQITRELTAPGQPALARIREVFGDAVVTDDGSLSRQALRERVFSDDRQRQQLEKLLHPLVYQALEDRSRSRPDPYVIWVVPLLLETDAADKVDRVLVIDCPEELQLQRASQRDHQEPEAIRRIMNQQVTRQQRLARADDVITNDGEHEPLQQQVQALHQKYLGVARQSDQNRTG